MPTDSRQYLTYDEAVALLPDGEDIHTFLNPNGTLLGADWPRQKILEALRAGKPELSGMLASRMNHGITMWREGGGFLFIATRKKLE